MAEDGPTSEAIKLEAEEFSLTDLELNANSDMLYFDE